MTHQKPWTAADERAAIVAWLRAEEELVSTQSATKYIQGEIADAIERGEHTETGSWQKMS